MSRLIFILGETGTGKSTSINPPADAEWSLYETKEGENPHEPLDPNDTFVINIQEAKDLPFRGSRKIYSKDNKNYAETRDTDTIISIMRQVDAKTTKSTIIIDDFQYQMSFAMYDDLENKSLNWDSYKIFSLNWYRVFEAAKSLKRDINVYILSHSDFKKAPNQEVQRSIKTVGKMTEDLLVPEGLSSIVLYTFVSPPGKSKDKIPKAEYYLVTNQWTTYPAKSPAGMFSSIMVPNSISFLNKTINSYYN